MSDATQQPQPEAAKADPVEELKARLAPQLEQAQEQLAQVNEGVKSFIKKNPGTTLLAAVAVGFLVGRWASRR